MPNEAPIPQNYAHTKLYRELKTVFRNKGIPRNLFVATIQQIKHVGNGVNWNARDVGGAFEWATSPQGHDFWAELHSLIVTFPMRKGQIPAW